jgi:hypothetical protein
METAEGPYFDIGHLMLSRNGIFSWCAMALLMAPTSLAQTEISAPLGR